MLSIPSCGDILRWLKEPLFHFLLIGAGIFVLFYQVADPSSERPDRIVVTTDDIKQMSALWSRRWQRPPTPTELDGLIESRIREEVLYREALDLGLERDDTIVRRRMAQKMEFLFLDLTESTPPTDEELEVFLRENSERFQQSARYSLMHVYLSTEQDAEQAYANAQLLLDDLRIQGEGADPVAVSDLFMLGHHLEDSSEQEIARLLGQDFVNDLSGLPVRQWQGPIQSAYGLHLVYVQTHTAARLPPLAEIRERVLTKLQFEQRRKVNDLMIKGLKDRYKIIIENPESVELANMSERT